MTLTDLILRKNCLISGGVEKESVHVPKKKTKAPMPENSGKINCVQLNVCMYNTRQPAYFPQTNFVKDAFQEDQSVLFSRNTFS